jgi:transcriptional repressor NrdR
MHCPFCRSTDTRVLDSRVADDGGAIRRRRVVSVLREAVQHRRADAADGAQAQRRHRAVHAREGDLRGPQGLQGPPGLRGRPGLPGPGRRGRAPRRRLGGVPANEVGLAILGPLRALDEVAWLRFASVYRAFESAEDFEQAISELRAERQLTVVEEARQRRLETQPQPDPITTG